MSTSIPSTPASGKSLYFDAPITHFNSTDMTTDQDKPISNGAAEVERNPSVANPAIIANGKAPEKSTTLDTTAEHLDDEKSAPAYTPPGPDDKLSRSYIDAKAPIADADELHTKEKEPTTSTVGTTEPSSPTSHPQRGTSVTSQSDYVRSPTSIISGGSGHRKDEGSTFGNGAAITGPNAAPEVSDTLHLRAATAETTLSAKTKSRLSKAELKDGKALSKIIKAESKAEKAALSTMIKELAELQKQQAAAIKREAKAHTAHTKALALHHKTEAKYLKLKAEYEANQLNSQNMETSLESERANARDVTDRTAEKAREVEKLRITHATDEREREAKILELNNGMPEKRFLCF